MGIYKTYKNIGETPLECLKRIVKDYNIPDSEKVTFAGRLDPAASGEMIFLSGNDIKDKDKYIHADKIYKVDFVLGISTDTGDLLGILKDVDTGIILSDSLKNEIENAFQNLVGKRLQDFHKFSSKMFEGKPLWMHARDGETPNVNHEITIYSIEVLEIYKKSLKEIFNQVVKITNLVGGDFRQNEIIKSWTLYKESLDQVLIVKVLIKCSSGTYMRVLAEELGEILKLPVCAYSIERTEILI
ncbi:hypothetical protein A3C57_02075 [Candidatus Nomurabacteria bacterium RIFCSPHIGHO2_02_FULL_33_12]|uniref:tRNA pseudouridine(55) synthase n=1 Tax=Candidatus Nomurabacteria bacterium RIFCSPLOWO2_01_FULL_33_17 TaxID=1801764 RepID=A0A1F6WPN1_9BACT|nr:MAG: hypothetical protein A3C57_02075 [Candidatus Nomurabacteria bacterium RIFCSPHIGHO2_02_FULL_33_12]OGI83685.1 MAG: hypothetical protein A2903_01345 [Candidatus Nomurabacteria bacterium RIFCSPLOWO2_01_FULL_33_17]